MAEKTRLEEIRERVASCAHCGVLLNRGHPHAPYCIGRVKHGPCDVCDSLRALAAARKVAGYDTETHDG